MPAVIRLRDAFSVRRADRQSNADSFIADRIDTDTITFHPELLMRWDDEADYVDHTVCVRPGRIATRPARLSARR